jgi:predicted RNase H-like nuclease (RuvC/YqgF family)
MDDTPSSGFQVTDLRSQVRRLDACDDTLTVIAADVVDLATQLRRLQEHAGELERLLSNQDTVLAAKERELTRLADAVATARRDADRSSRALEDMTAKTGERDAQTETLERELDALRAEVITRDGQLAEVRAELELFRRTSATKRGRSETQGHVRFVGFPEGYRLAVSDEPCARAGDVVQIDGCAFRVERIGPSPLPADDRPCAFLTLS